MDFTAILATVTKGLGIATSLITAGRNAMPVITALEDLATASQAGTVTPEQLAETESILDANLDAFNAPLA